MKTLKLFTAVCVVALLMVFATGCQQEGCRGVGGKPRAQHVPKHKPSGLFPKGAWGSYHVTSTAVKTNG